MFIVKAAIMYSNGETIEGMDYGHISSLAQRLSYTGERIYGFVTSSGKFVLPDEAAEIAFNAKQIDRPVSRLAPEMLWKMGVEL